MSAIILLGSLNGAVNAVKMWVDDVIQLDVANAKTVSSTGQQWDSLVLVSNWSSNPGWEHDATNNVYFDDVEIFSDRGSGATGSMASGTISGGVAPTAPPPPVGLRVVR